MKRLLLLLIILGSLLYAESKAPKMGCILAQQGEVKADWTVYGNKKLGVQGSFFNVKYRAKSKEGTNFKELFIGSSISMDTDSTEFQKNSLVAKIIHIQAKKRIAKGSRDGIVVFNITTNGISKNIPMIYTYNKGNMQIKGLINLKEFKLSKESRYSELSIKLQIHSIVCHVPIK